MTKQLIIGLPSSGKTTFLAALWHVAEYDGINASLIVDSLEGDREHLNEIRSRWLRCETQRRTSASSETTVTMRLRDRQSHLAGEFHFPDMSGESFRAQWTTRQWPLTFRELVDEVDGILMFVHPLGVREPVRIDQADLLTPELGGPEELEPEGTGEEVKPWNPEDAATQVQLVGLLQFIAQLRSDRQAIGIVVSAWDSAATTTADPTAWLAQRLPLLWQYLLANSERWTHRVYGISAQGGDFTTDSERLLREVVPSNRIRVVGQDAGPHDITAPVRWLMTATESTA